MNLNLEIGDGIISINKIKSKADEDKLVGFFFVYRIGYCKEYDFLSNSKYKLKKYYWNDFFRNLDKLNYQNLFLEFLTSHCYFNCELTNCSLNCFSLVFDNSYYLYETFNLFDIYETLN